MPQQQSTAMIKTAAKDLAETITDRVEDTIQSEKERYIKYKASVNTRFVPNLSYSFFTFHRIET